MVHKLVKTIILKGIARGIKVLPEAQIDRVLELVHLKQLLIDLEVNCVIDAGANRGQFASDLRGIGYTNHIVSFEPVQGEFTHMSDHFRNDPKWTGYQLALGCEHKRAKLSVPARTIFSSFLSPLARHPGTTYQEVEMVRLDEMFQKITAQIANPRVFLKMDTQGFDREVFLGAKGCLDRIVGLQSELSIKPIYKNIPSYVEALALFEAAGFELYNLSVVNRVFGKALVEMNAFMRKTGSSKADAESLAWLQRAWEG